MYKRSAIDGFLEELFEGKGAEAIVDALSFLFGAFVITKEGLVIGANKGFFELIEYDRSELYGMHAFDLIPPGEHAAMKARLSTEDITRYELKLLPKSKKIKTVQVFPKVFSVKGEVYKLAEFIDITEQKIASESIIELGSILHNSLNEIYIFDTKSLKFIDVNVGACTNLQHSLKEILQLTPLDIKPKFSAKSFNELVSPLKTLSQDKLIFETVHQRKDSTIYPVEVHLQLAKYAGNSCYLANVIDITNRRISERKIKRIERALNTLLEINQAIIFSRSEIELLQHICKSLINTGGYLLSWIGFPEHDEQKTVLPVSRCGYEKDYIEPAHISWADTTSGQCPTGTSIRTKEAVVARDILNDPQFKSWRKEAEEHGYQSSIALPLLADKEVIAVINIYAAEKDAFNDEEINLLQELSADVAYGIKSQRLAIEQKEYSIKLERSLTETVRAIALTAEKRDPYTAGHMDRVAELAIYIGMKLGLPSNTLEGIYLGASIHDIGKIYIPAEILNRPGKLTDAEFQIIKMHAKVGYEIIKDIDFPWPIANMILSHHERLDGSGYPEGLKGDEISYEAQLLAVADVVEAVSSHRPYRAAKGMDEGLAIIQAGKGIHYNPEIVDACVAVIKKEGFEFSTSF